MKMSLLGLPRTKGVAKLNEEMAVELGAEMLGEILVFFVGTGTIYLEYRRQAGKESDKEAAQNEKLEDLSLSVRELTRALENQDAHIRELERLVYTMDDNSTKKSK